MATDEEIRAKDVIPKLMKFREGDGIYGDGQTSFFMEHQDLANNVIEDSANNTVATEADLVAGSKLPIMTANGPKSLPGNAIAKASEQIALTTYAENVAASIAPPFDPTKPNDANGVAYYAGEEVFYNDEKYTFRVNKSSGVWEPAKAYKSNNVEQTKTWALKVGSRFYKVVKIGRWLWMAENLDEAIGTEGTDYVGYSGNNATFFGKYYAWSALCKSDGSNSDALNALLGGSGFHVPDADDFLSISSLYLKDSALPTYLWRTNSVQNNSNGLSLVPSYRDGSYSTSGQYQLWSSISESESNAKRFYGGFGVSTKLDNSNAAAKTTMLPVRLCAKMNASTDDPRDYGCVDFGHNFQLPVLPTEGSFNLRIKNGVIYTESDPEVVGKQTSSMPTLHLMTTKKYHYADGTQPKVDWYLFCNFETLKFYSTRDLKNFTYLFKWSGTVSLWDYSWAIRQNNDILAIYRAEVRYNGSALLDDSQKRNPLVFLYSENYSVKHEVDFGESLKPSGWISNFGFLNMPNGDSIMCEYARPNVKTINVWKIAASANILDKASYVSKVSYNISGDLIEGIKHFHCVQYDPYSGVVYAARGDDNVGATVIYSADGGDTWSAAYDGGSEKYCRLLNFIFLEDYIYWATDSAISSYHYVFRAARDENGVIDYSTVEELEHIDDGTATYGVSYLPLCNALVLNERHDVSAESIKVYVYDLNTLTLYVAGELSSYSGSNVSGLGFRTEYTEFNPSGNTVVYGFGKRDRVNLFKGLGNQASNLDVVGTLCLTFAFDGSRYIVTLDTVYC